MAACTSRAAASMLRLRSNCRVTPALPSELDDVISVTEAMRPNWRSRGVATEEAMVSGLAPGRRGVDADGGEVHLRQRRNREDAERHRARQRDGQGQQRGGDRSANEGLGYAHGLVRHHRFRPRGPHGLPAWRRKRCARRSNHK